MNSQLFFLFLVFIITAMAAPCHSDEIYSKNRKANELYKQGKFKEAQKLYEDALLLSPSNNSLKMNNGSALYKMGKYDKAEEAYNGTLSNENKKVLADAHYNLGNILFKNAEQLQQQGDPSAQEKFKAALQQYIQSLDINPDDMDAKWNLQLTHQKIKELEQQQQQQQNNKDNKDNKNDQQKNDQNNQQNNDDKKQDEKQEQQEQNEQDQKQQQQQQQQQSEMKESQDQKDMKKEDARRLIELYADDADSLNKPDKKAARRKQPEQDW
ncbi:MAG: tetratricopeptide repeat protein [Fibrobacter sp.]|nr:tetratricopeptide repeat protein [Fibrobacter sp.]